MACLARFGFQPLGPEQNFEKDASFMNEPFVAGNIIVSIESM